QVKPLIGRKLKRVIVAAYSDYLKQATDLRIPELIAAPRQPIGDPAVTLWNDAMARDLRPGPITARPDDLCVMPYTSGTTGSPKGCMHTHRTVMFTLVAGVHWFGPDPSQTTLAVLPFFHVTGMQGSMNGTIYSGNTIVLLPRWDREVAAQLIQRYKITAWQCIPTMVVDFLADGTNPKGRAEAFVGIAGKRFFRTGVLARRAEDGYFFWVARRKRMINPSGFKVWPAEGERMLYHHPAVQEASIIAARDPRG